MSTKDDIKGGKSEFVGTEEVEHLEKKPSSSLSDTKEDGYLLAADVRPSAERALVRKLDMRLLPTIILIFIMNYIDVSLLPMFLDVALCRCRDVSFSATADGSDECSAKGVAAGLGYVR